MWLDILLTLLIAAALLLALRKIIRDRRRGKSCACGCDGCPASSGCNKLRP